MLHQSHCCDNLDCTLVSSQPHQLVLVGKSFKDESRLALFALEQQAVAGSCKEPKPWGWNVVESAKWQAWSHLQDMAPVEAMRLYVRLLEDELVRHCSCYMRLLLEKMKVPQLYHSMVATSLN